MKFVFETQTDRIASYLGPSGISYTISKGEPFNVDNELDIEFFKSNKRFKKAGLFSKKDVQQNPDEIMSKKLKVKKFDFLSEATKKKLIKLYGTYEELEQTILENYKLDPSIPNKQAEQLVEIIKGD